LWRIFNELDPTKDEPVLDGPKSSDPESSDPKVILAPLDEVFLEDRLKDDIIEKVAIPELLEGEIPGYSGVILFGPPGTGKTVLLRAIGEVYKRSGAYAKEVSVSEINSKWIGEFSNNLENEIKKALNEVKKRKKPSFLAFDEGSILAQSASEGATSVSKHYQEAIDVLKRYVGNDPNIVLGISTNLLDASFEQALTREGRLRSYFIGYPDLEQRKRMWKYFTRKYGVLELKDKDAETLASETGEEQGAFIEEFCRNYLRARKQSVLKDKGFMTLVDALKNKARVKESDVKSTINFKQFYADVKSSLTKKYDGKSDKKEERRPLGFHAVEVRTKDYGN